MARLSTSTTRKAALGIAAAAAMTTSAAAADFTQKECGGIAETALQIVKAVDAKTLSREFRQSFRNWLGADLRCDGPKDILIVSHDDSIAYRAIRSALLAGSKPLSLEKAGLRVIVQGEKTSEAVPAPTQRRSDAAPSVPAVN